jgi:hypothetical protein
MVERSCGAIEGHGTAGPLQAVCAEPEVLDDYRPRLKEHFGDFGHPPQFGPGLNFRTGGYDHEEGSRSSPLLRFSLLPSLLALRWR